MAVRGLVLALLALGAAGCADHRLTAERQAMLAAYVGRSEADIVRSFGVPSQTFETEGRRFLAYVDSSVNFVPGISAAPPWAPAGPWGWGGGFPQQMVQLVCQTTFEIANGKVVGATLHGNGCS